MLDPIRCGWSMNHPLMIEYHDTEWGVPVHDDRKLFEFLVLDAAQAGLSWQTVLLKRENYRKAFDNFDPEKVARYTGKRIAKLLTNPGIIRNRLKVRSAVTNAQAFLKVRDEFGSFDRYIWQFVGGRNEQGYETARVQLCRLHDLLRLHAGGWHGERSPRHLLPPPRSATLTAGLVTRQGCATLQSQ
jgi:DNA-3-methyladenine glycosylase I